jgi:hypothetical protein
MLNTYHRNQNLFCGMSVAATPECLYKGISHPASFQRPSERNLRGFFVLVGRTMTAAAINCILTVGLQQREDTSAKDGRYVE